MPRAPVPLCPRASVLALQLTAPGTLELRDVPRPTPAADQVLVQVAGCGVCHTDIGFWKDGVAHQEDAARSPSATR